MFDQKAVGQKRKSLHGKREQHSGMQSA